MVQTKTLPTRITLDKALAFMRQGGRLVLMHTVGHGQEYYMVPGGHVARKDACAILNRPDVQPFDDGLFPGHAQSWKMGA